MNEKIEKSDDEWRQELSEAEFSVCRMAGTEPPFSGVYYDHKESGHYLCRCCGALLFSSESKYDSGSGWPSYWQPANDDAITTSEDMAHGMRRVEVRCAACDSHLGHVFPDGPQPTGLRYCINSLSLQFDKG
ncbi:MAG: peptide-methionine (R)-S-oxide reductase MsrB [Gammaproteobacteria bacterium]|nr:peptide-methionine (R)-S-oxide reductase MsrB [Gammaproteobacteria bacterium]